MSGKNYIIKYSAMDQLYLLICSRINKWYNELEDWSEGYNRIVSMNSFKGESADSAKSYLEEVHGILLCSIQQTLQSFQARYLLYRRGYNSIDSDLYANLPQKAIQNVERKLGTESETLQDISDSIGRSLRSVSDLLYLSNPSIFYLKDAMDELKQELNNLDWEIEGYESSELTAVRGDMQGLISSLQTVVQDYYVNGTNIASYQSGAVTGNTNMLDLYQRVMAAGEYVNEHKEEIEIAAVEQEEAFAQMQADYEAACQAREEEGKAKIIQGSLAIVVGTLAVVGTAGMAAPVVITAGVFGTCSFAYGVSNTVEGAQDWYLGSIGDLETAAVNPIRDTIFCGNQELYDFWGSLSMTVAGMCVPVGQSINGVAGMGKDVLVETALKTIVKETVKDTVSDIAAGEITDFATTKFNLNAVEAATLNIGVSLGLDKGLDFAGQKLGVSDGPSFTDDMTFDEAKRYNQYWNDLKNGVHINYPGLTSSDIAAWELADAKLNEHLAVRKVDSDAVVELRAKEISAQEHFYYPAASYDASYSKTLDTIDAEEYAFDAIKGNEKADSIVLGKYEKGCDTSYDAVAIEIDAQYFNLDNWDDLTLQYSNDEIWKINEKFLDIQISSGRDIYLTHDPALFEGQKSFYSREIQYLYDNGYKFIKKGDLWHAVR